MAPRAGAALRARRDFRGHHDPVSGAERTARHGRVHCRPFGYNGFVESYRHRAVKHLHRYINQFAGRKNIRELSTLEQMGERVRGVEHKRLCVRDLAA